MHKKSGFTIIEMMIVMAIIGIMIVMTQNYFTSANKIYYEGEACINNMYYAIKDISNAALLGRTRTLSGVFVSSGNIIQTPDRYSVILRTPSYYNDPQFPINIEDASGLVEALLSNPQTTSVLGTYNTQSIDETNLNAWGYFYRGTGNITDTLDTTGSAYGVLYFPIGGVNYLSSSYTPVKGCANSNFFVSYIISTPATGATMLRVGFQNSSTLSDKKMLIQPSQRLSGSLTDLNTGAINFRICNTAVQCKETHRIFFDTRVNDIFLQKCATYTGNMKCDTWQGGDIN